jgi:hypothetical protein
MDLTDVKKSGQPIAWFVSAFTGSLSEPSPFIRIGADGSQVVLGELNLTRQR